MYKTSKNLDKSAFLTGGGGSLTSRTLLAALLLGVTPAMAAELADVDLSKIPLNKPTLDYLHENNVQIPQTEYDDEGNLVESGSILAPESAYTLTEVPAGEDGAAPAGDNIITKFEYNASDGSFTPKYYQLDLKQTTYGEGNQSYSVTLENSPVKDVIINVFYDYSNTSGRISVSNDTHGDITSNFIGNSYNYKGGAIYNYDNSTIGDITGNFIGNSANGYGGAIHNEYRSTIGNIIGNFIGNAAGYHGGAIYNYNGTTIGDITGDFIGNYADEDGGAIYNYGNIGDITGNFIGNSAGYNGGAIYNNNSTIGNITGNFIGNSAYGGGAIALWGSSDYEWNSTNTSITDSLFRANIATSEGGAIIIGELYYNHVPLYGTLVDSVSIKNSSFENNKAQRGGAISFTKDVSPTMLGPASLLPDDTSVELYDGGDYAEPQMPEYNLVIDNSSFKNNLAETVDNIDAYGGAIDFKGISANPEDYGISIGEQTTYSNIVFNVVDEDGNVIETVFDGYGIIPNSSGGSGGSLPITSDPMKNIIKNSYFENNKAISENNAYGGAISLTSTGSFLSNNFVEGEKVVQNINISDRPDWMTEEEFIQEMKEEFNVPDDELAASGIFKNLETLKETYASRNSLELVNTSFVNNTAETTGADKEAHGGAIFSQTNLKITADNGISLFDNNKVIVNGNTDNEAIYMNNINPDGSELQLNIEAKNNGIVQFNDKISGDKPYDLNVDGDSSSKVFFNDDVKNANITLGKTNVYLGKDTAFDQSNSLTINTELYSMINDYAGVSNLNSLVLKSDTDFTADVDLANKEMDRFTAGSYDIQNDAKLHVIGMNLLSDANTEDDVTAIYFAESELKNNVLNGTGELPDSYQTAYTPIYKYNVSYDNENQYDGKGDGGYFLFTRGDKIIYPNGGGTGTTGNPSDAFNPAVLATPVGNLAAGQAAMNEAFKYVFEHADAFTQLPSMERYAKINANKYALSTDFNDNMPSYAEQLHNNAVWFRPYTTFETMNIKNGPKVDAITYGSLVGFDGDFKEMKNGWSRIFTGYAGYMGSSLNYSGVDTTMNGGLLGFTETFYKGNFWTAITASAGASVGESHTMYGKEDYTSLLAGVGSKTGYNFEFKDGKFIIQPIMFLSYTFVNTFDYKNAAGVSIESDPLHTIQLNPSVRFIANLKGGWQPYASVGMVWNLMNESKVTANNVKLPEMSVKPYVEYGVGVQRNWADKFTAFLQAMIRNGGRNGIALTGGFRFMLGSDDDNDKPKVKKEIKSL